MTEKEHNEIIQRFGDTHRRIDKLLPEPTFEKQQILAKLTEAGMWFRMLFDLERSKDFIPKVGMKARPKFATETTITGTEATSPAEAAKLSDRAPSNAELKN